MAGSGSRLWRTARNRETESEAALLPLRILCWSLPSFLPSSTSIAPSSCPFHSETAVFPRSRPAISIGPLSKDVYSGVSLVIGLNRPWWFAIYRPGSISRAQTVTQSSHDPWCFLSIPANLLQSPGVVQENTQTGFNSTSILMLCCCHPLCWSYKTLRVGCWMIPMVLSVCFKLHI